MRTILLFLEDSEYNSLKKLKGKKTWKQLILERCLENENI